MSLADYLQDKEKFLDYLLWDYQQNNNSLGAADIAVGATRYTLPQFLGVARNEKAMHHGVANEIYYNLYKEKEVQVQFRKYLVEKRKG